MKASKLAEAAHATGHADEPLHRVKIVQTLIEQHAAAFPLPRRAPPAARVIGLGAIPVRVDPVDAHDLSEFAALNQFLHLLVTWLGAHLKHAAKNNLWVLPARGNESFGVGFVGGNWLLNHRMNTRFQRHDAERRMLKMRRGHNDGVHLPGFDQRLAVREGFQRLVAVQRRHGIAHGNKITTADLFIREIFGVELADVSHADDAKSHFVHVPKCNERMPSAQRKFQKSQFVPKCRIAMAGSDIEKIMLTVQRAALAALPRPFPTEHHECISAIANFGHKSYKLSSA